MSEKESNTDVPHVEDMNGDRVEEGDTVDVSPLINGEPKYFRRKVRAVGPMREGGEGMVWVKGLSGAYHHQAVKLSGPAPQMNIKVHDEACLIFQDERLRQVEDEGWSEEHDNTHYRGEMAQAAACYAMSCGKGAGSGDGIFLKGENEYSTVFKEAWPWSNDWDKRKKHGRAKRIVIAGSLLMAELERMIRKYNKNRTKIASNIANCQNGRDKGVEEELVRAKMKELHIVDFEDWLLEKYGMVFETYF